jgi:hypothetical protein
VSSSAPYAVTIRNSSLQRIGKVDRLTSLDVIARFNGIGTWELVVPLGTAQAALLSQTSGVIITYQDEAGPVLMSGPVVDLSEQWGASDAGQGTLSVRGVSDDVVVADRVAYQVPTSAATSQSGSDYDRRGAPTAAETVIKQFVDVNAGPGALTARRTTGLTIQADAASGSTVKGSARMTPLADLVTELASAGGVGWRVVQSGGGLVFQVYVPTDRTGTARFARDLGNLVSYTYTRLAPGATRAIVGGSGDGTARVFRELSDTTAESDWGRRIEAFIDARDSSDTTELDQRGTQHLVDNGEQSTLGIETVDTPKLVFGVDYQLGDKVTVEPDPTHKVQDVLREVRITWDAQNGPKKTSSVGTRATTGTPKLLRQLATLNRRLAAIEAKK